MSVYLTPTGTCWWRSVSGSALLIFRCTLNPTYQADVRTVDMQFFALFWNSVSSLNKQRMTINLVWCQLAFRLQRGAFLEDIIIVCTGHRMYSCRLKDFEVYVHHPRRLLSLSVLEPSHLFSVRFCLICPRPAKPIACGLHIAYTLHVVLLVETFKMRKCLLNLPWQSWDRRPK